ncbi:hypothetical protein JW935_17795 [candidate division KSB1 bacterium]|nr:hypothetical protein [candidate division KSB1 bacterium]
MARNIFRANDIDNTLRIDNSRRYGETYGNPGLDLMTNNNLIVGNQGHAIIESIGPGSLVFRNNTITGNSQSYILFIEDWTLQQPAFKMLNNILYDNEIKTGRIIYAKTVLPDSFQLSYTCLDTLNGEYDDLKWYVGDITLGPGNIFNHPSFADTFYYYLNVNSPCIDMGDPSFEVFDAEDPTKPGVALWPAMGTLRNDMGVYGGNYYTYPVPVELAIFEAEFSDDCILVKWQTLSESNNYGFDLERSSDNRSFKKLAFI